MLIKEIKGYELEKAQPNTSEDFFNRSEVTFIDQGVEKTFYLLYVRYFDEILNEFVPFESDPLFTIDEKPIYFKDVIGLICMLKDTTLKKRKRVYINEKKDLINYCKGIDPDKLKEIVGQIMKGGYELKTVQA
ncbi:hypothetical protein [Calidifontibacillus erzurumensis]|uniref:Uncharacterized protein n=1 Tax=Calidifontibacillus erzurumensis TaxID=2741433 RepID=A0A8J8KAW1_9BACI|nr:hypothetical protein [Calidifontibacillus erzurumensis]NSL50468.1 hypothetical protein [Calidifontibacillus erzurumensis]